MLDFMTDGGALMWPLLVAGVGIAVAATRCAFGQSASFDIDRAARMLLAVSFAWSALGMRYAFLAGFTDVTDEATELSLRMRGFAEALAPAILGLVMFAIISAISALPRARTLPA